MEFSILVLCALVGSTAERWGAEVEVPYRDHEDGRVLAIVAVRSGGPAVLEIASRALDPRVDPEPGHRGLHGANYRTARSMEHHLPALAIVTEGKGRSRRGRFVPCEWRTIERWSDPDPIAPLSIERADSPVLVRIVHRDDLGAWGYGPRTTVIELGNVALLEIEWEARPEGARIHRARQIEEGAR